MSRAALRRSKRFKEDVGENSISSGREEDTDDDVYLGQRKKKNILDLPTEMLTEIVNLIIKGGFYLQPALMLIGTR